MPARYLRRPNRSVSPPTATTTPLDVYGRTWELTVHPRAREFIGSRSGVPALVLLAALAMALLLETVLPRPLRYGRVADSPPDVRTRQRCPLRHLDPSQRPRRTGTRGVLPFLRRTRRRQLPTDGSTTSPPRQAIPRHVLGLLHNPGSGTLDDDTLRDPGQVLTELVSQMDQQSWSIISPSGTASTSPSIHTPAGLIGQFLLAPLLIMDCLLNR